MRNGIILFALITTQFDLTQFVKYFTCREGWDWKTCFDITKWLLCAPSWCNQSVQHGIWLQGLKIRPDWQFELLSAPQEWEDSIWYHLVLDWNKNSKPVTTDCDLEFEVLSSICKSILTLKTSIDLLLPKQFGWSLVG